MWSVEHYCFPVEFFPWFVMLLPKVGEEGEVSIVRTSNVFPVVSSVS